MAGSRFPIPREFADQLEYVQSSDTRTDEEIVKSLENPPLPVNFTNKNIWAFWHSGVATMPSWCKRNVIDWVRLNGPEWTVRVLDSHILPNGEKSPSHYSRFTSPELLPTALKQNTMTGPWIRVHTSDLVRGAVLMEHGGVYLDVGCMLLTDLDTLCWSQLSDNTSQYEICIMSPVKRDAFIFNHFIAARADDPFISRWHKLFLHFWDGRTTMEGILSHPLLAPLHSPEWSQIDFQKMWEVGFRMPFDRSKPAAAVMEYVAQPWAWYRLSMIKDCKDSETGTPFNANKYWLEKVLVLDLMTDSYGFERTLHRFRGEEMLEFYQTPLEENPHTDTTGLAQEKQRKELVKQAWHLLSSTTMHKVVRGGGTVEAGFKAFGTILDNANKRGEHPESQEGTIAELLRYGSVHFRQTRKMPYVPAPGPFAPRVAVLEGKGLYEP